MFDYFIAAVRSIWRLLPREARRRLFVRVTTMMAPSSGETSERLPVVVAGVLSSATGLGESARMNIDGLHHAGLPFSTINLSGSLLAEANLPAYRSKSSLSPEGAGTLIVHTPGSTLPYALLLCGKKAVQGKRLVGFWHWELPTLPEDWHYACERLDEIWVPSEFCASAVRKSFGGPIRIIPHPVDVEGVRRQERHGDKFTALTIFNMASGFERKNPLASIRAFKKAFNGDPSARMLIKVVSPDHYPEGMVALNAEVADSSNIEIMVNVMPRKGVMQLIAESDAVLSLHRAEGFGMLAAEAQLIGTPVIATDWSATKEFVTAETGIPIPYSMVAAIDPQGGNHDPSQFWADADVDAAAAALVRLREDQDGARAMTERARLQAEKMFSVDNYAGLIKSALK
jgi:glycosyltransferase involved in cell wall biosynthesis